MPSVLHLSRIGGFVLLVLSSCHHCFAIPGQQRTYDPCNGWLQHETFSEQILRSDVVVIGEFVKSAKQRPRDPDNPYAGTTEYRIVQIGKDLTKCYQVGTSVVVDYFIDSEIGNKSILCSFQRSNNQRVWGRLSSSLSVEAIEYVMHLPSLEIPARVDLSYFLKHLRSPDPIIDEDAHRELEFASWENFLTLKPLLDPQQLRVWIETPDTPVERLATYGVMLGIAGRDEDREFLLNKFQQSQDGPGPSLVMSGEGLVIGYLLLSGSAGLDHLNERYLEPERSVQSRSTTTYFLIRALRFFWETDQSSISQDQLRQSMRMILRHDHINEIALVSLTRWHDWGAIEEIVMSYRQAQVSPLMIRAVAIYCLSLIDDANTNDGSATAEQMTLATNTLQLVKEEHPERYQQAERFFQIEKRRNAAKVTKPPE